MGHKEMQLTEFIQHIVMYNSIHIGKAQALQACFILLSSHSSFSTFLVTCFQQVRTHSNESDCVWHWYLFATKCAN